MATAAIDKPHTTEGKNASHHVDYGVTLSLLSTLEDNSSGRGHGDAVAVGLLLSAHEPHPVGDQPQVRPFCSPVRAPRTPAIRTSESPSRRGTAVRRAR